MSTIHTYQSSLKKTFILHFVSAFSVLIWQIFGSLFSLLKLTSKYTYLPKIWSYQRINNHFIINQDILLHLKNNLLILNCIRIRWHIWVNTTKWEVPLTTEEGISYDIIRQSSSRKECMIRGVCWYECEALYKHERKVFYKARQ